MIEIDDIYLDGTIGPKTYFEINKSLQVKFLKDNTRGIKNDKKEKTVQDIKF